MRRLMVVDRDGTIVATAPHPDDMGPPEPGAPVFGGFAPSEDQQVVEIEVPEELASPDGLRELHSSFRIELSGREPGLTCR